MTLNSYANAWCMITPFMSGSVCDHGDYHGLFQQNITEGFKELVAPFL